MFNQQIQIIPTHHVFRGREKQTLGFAGIQQLHENKCTKNQIVPNKKTGPLLEPVLLKYVVEN
jgi:hypothetical protein